MRKSLFILFVLSFTCCFAQNDEDIDPFDKYAPPGENYTDLKLALKVVKQVYRLKLDYQTLDPKSLPKIGKLTDLAALQFTDNGLTELPAGI